MSEELQMLNQNEVEGVSGGCGKDDHKFGSRIPKPKKQHHQGFFHCFSPLHIRRFKRPQKSENAMQ